MLAFGLLVFLVLFAGAAFDSLPALVFFAVDFFAVDLEACVFLVVVLGFLACFFASGSSPAFAVVAFLGGVLIVILSIVTRV